MFVITEFIITEFHCTSKSGGRKQDLLATSYLFTSLVLFLATTISKQMSYIDGHISRERFTDLDNLNLVT